MSTKGSLSTLGYISITISTITVAIVLYLSVYTLNQHSITTKVISDGTLYGTLTLDQDSRTIEYKFSTLIDVSKLYIMRRDQTMFIELYDIHVDNHLVYGVLKQDKNGNSLRRIIEELDDNWIHYYVLAVPKEHPDNVDEFILIQDP